MAAFILAATVIFISSCKKDPKTPDEAGSAQLIKIQTSATEFTTFEYNTSGKISKVISQNGTEQEVNTVTYNGDKIKTVTTEGAKMDFTYTGNKVSKVQITATEDETAFNGVINFTYQNDLLTQTIFTLEVEEEGDEVVDVPSTKINYEYFANGDVKKKIISLHDFTEDKWKLSETSVYEYDTKNNPMAVAAEAFLGLFQIESAHNVTKEIITGETGTLENTVVYEYQYNNKNYPTQVKKTVTPAGGAAGTPETTTFTYK